MWNPTRPRCRCRILRPAVPDSSQAAPLRATASSWSGCASQCPPRGQERGGAGRWLRRWPPLVAVSDGFTASATPFGEMHLYGRQIPEKSVLSGPDMTDDLDKTL